MEKRGQAEVLEITLLFEFIAGVLIAGILIYAVMTINETSSITGEYLNRDYGMIKNVIQGEPGDYKIIYPTGTFTFKDDKFVKPGGIKFTGDNKVKITKENGEIKTEMMR